MANMKCVETLAALTVLVAFTGGCARASNPPPPLTRDRQRESLEKAVRWKDPSPPVVLQLAGDYLATGREREGYVYFEARERETSKSPLFTALTGLLQARMASEVPLLERVAWVESAIARLDRAAASGGLPRYLRGIVFADLPARFHRADQAVEDLTWTLALPASTFPPGFRRGAWR